MRFAALFLLATLTAAGQVQDHRNYGNSPPQENEILRAYAATGPKNLIIRGWIVQFMDKTPNIIGDCNFAEYLAVASNIGKETTFYEIKEKFGGCAAEGTGQEEAMDDIWVKRLPNPKNK